MRRSAPTASGWARLVKGARTSLAIAVIGVTALATRHLKAQSSDVASTLHNLSVTGPGEIRSATETEVCKFCHIPHNAVEPVPLWGHAMSRVTQYSTPPLRLGRDIAEPAPQPDGASRLCLSCHDGTVALGQIVTSRKPIPMRGTQRLTPEHRGFIGTDLTGSHPVSFRLRDDEGSAASDSSDMAVKRLSVILRERRVALDGQGKMQCTTCHDPHSDAHYKEGVTPHFWVKPTVSEVCIACHELR